MESFALTVRKQAKVTEQVTEADFDPIIKRMGKKLMRYVFENDKTKDHKHLHGIVELPKGYFHGHLMIRGFHTHFEPIFNLEGWVKYMEKDSELRNKTSFDLIIQEATEDRARQASQISDGQ